MLVESFRRWIALCEGRVVDIYLGVTDRVEVHVNPSSGDIARILKGSRNGTYRGVLGRDLIVWCADEVTHDHVDDSGGLGRLTGIRFMGDQHRITLSTYGREGAEWPLNAETMDDFASDEEIEECFRHSPLVAKAFGTTPASIPNYRKR